MSGTALRTPVMISRTGPVLTVADPPPELVGQLAVGRLEPDGDCPDLVLTKLPLFSATLSPSGEARADVWVGLRSVLQGLLRSSRVPFALETGPSRTAGDPVIAGAITDPAIVPFAATMCRGLVRYAGNLDPLWLAAQVCLGLPGARVVVLVRRRADAVALGHLLVRHGIRPGTTGDGRAEAPRERVTVTLLGQMGTVRLDRADIVLVADALDRTWEDPLTAAPAPDPNAPGAPQGPRPTALMERLLGAGGAAVIGMLPADRPLSPFERARLWQLYGERELVLPRSGHVERSVLVGSVACHTPGIAKDAVMYVRNKVRMSPPRNRRLAALAKALQCGDVTTLRRLTPASALAEYGASPRHVLVLAENLKQAAALRRHLPGWPLVSGLGDDTTVLTATATTETRGVIATALGVEALAGDEYDVIVRADPGDGPPPLPPGWLTTSAASVTPVLLLDVADTGHHLTALWSRRRRRQYRAAGWAVLDEDPDVSAWLRFRELIHGRRASR